MSYDFRYLAGYLARTLNNKFNCENCRNELTQEVFLDDNSELLILLKSYPTNEGVSHLTAPSPLMVKITINILTTFQENYESLKTKKGLKETMVNICRGEMCKNDYDSLSIGTPCNIHREFLLNHLMKLKIRKHILYLSRLLKMPKKKSF